MVFTVPRRHWLGMAAVGGLTTATGVARSRLSSAVADSQVAVCPSMTPAEVLECLYAGNRRFVAGASIAPHRDRDRLEEVALRQTPFAAFLGCADSRVPIEIVFDQGFGDLFVTRTAGNVAATENIASLEFGTEMLGAKVLYVLGHTSCGAVAAAARAEPVPGQISALFQHIRPAVRAAHGDPGAAVRENVRLQARTLVDSSPVLSALVARGTLLVAGGIFDLHTGRVEPVEIA